MIRLGAFAGVFALMAVWELLAPRRHLEFGRGPRWPSNLGIVVIDTLLQRSEIRRTMSTGSAPAPVRSPAARLAPAPIRIRCGAVRRGSAAAGTGA